MNKKNLVNNNTDSLIPNIQTDFSKNIKLSETVERDKGCVILREKHLGRLLPAIDKNDCVIKKHIDHRIVNINKKIFKVDGIV